MKNRWVPLFMVLGVLALALASLIEACGGGSSTSDASANALDLTQIVAPTDGPTVDLTPEPVDLGMTTHPQKITAACTNYCMCISMGDSSLDQSACVTGCSAGDPNSSYNIGSNLATALTDQCLSCLAQTTCIDLEAGCQMTCKF